MTIRALGPRWLTSDFSVIAISSLIGAQSVTPRGSRTGIAKVRLPSPILTILATRTGRASRSRMLVAAPEEENP
jgi:hypothetical protein